MQRYYKLKGIYPFGYQRMNSPNESAHVFFDNLTILFLDCLPGGQNHN
jgi:hypothetical protein